MFGRKILFLAAWYVAGNVVSTVYNGSKKSWKNAKIKTDPKSLADKFLTTQKNFISDMEKRYVSDENKEKLAEKKRQFLEASEKYLEQWEKILSEMSTNETYSKSKNKFFDIVGTWYAVIKNSISGKVPKNTEVEAKIEKKTK